MLINGYVECCFQFFTFTLSVFRHTELEDLLGMASSFVICCLSMIFLLSCCQAVTSRCVSLKSCMQQCTSSGESKRSCCNNCKFLHGIIKTPSKKTEIGHLHVPGNKVQREPKQNEISASRFLRISYLDNVAPVNKQKNSREPTYYNSYKPNYFEYYNV